MNTLYKITEYQRLKIYLFNFGIGTANHLFKLYTNRIRQNKNHKKLNFARKVLKKELSTIPK